MIRGILFGVSSTFNMVFNMHLIQDICAVYPVEKLLSPGGLPIKKEDSKEEMIVNVDGDDEDDDELCSAKKCLRPLGDDINWVQCDLCEKWYHLLCIGKTSSSHSCNSPTMAKGSDTPSNSELLMFSYST